MFLIIDDSRIDRMIAKKRIEINYPESITMEVDCGEQALEWFDNIAPTINEEIIVLLDIRMPEMCGFSFLEVYKTFSESIRSKTRIVMLSSTLDTTDIKRASNHKLVDMLLEKPLNNEQLLKLTI